MNSPPPWSWETWSPPRRAATPASPRTAAASWPPSRARPKEGVLGLSGAEPLPPRELAGLHPAAAVPGPPPAGLLPALALAEAAPARTPPLPPLVEGGGTGRFPALYVFPESEQKSLQLIFFPQGDERPPADADEEDAFLARARRPLDAREVDLLLVVPPGFRDRLDDGH